MYWDWKLGGVALGLTFFLAVAFVKPIGVSTQFVIFDGIVASQVDKTLVTKDETAKSGYVSTSAYLNKSGGKYAKSVANPLNYGFLFVLCMFIGGLLGRLSQKDRDKNPLKQVPDVHRKRFGDTPLTRHVLAFAGGVAVLWGARLAGGCTSGHMMSGMMQTSVSGYLFAMAAFAVAVPTALVMYKR